MNTAREISYSVVKDNKKGFLDQYGEIIGSCCYDKDFLDSMFLNLVKVSINKKYGLLSPTGELVVPCVYDSIDCIYGDNLSWPLLVCKDKKYGYVDESGKEIIPCEYIHANSFVQGSYVTGVEIKENEYGIINKQGKLLMNSLQMVLDFENREECTWIKKNDKWGIIDNRGHLIIPCIYDGIFHFQNGLAVARKNDKYGVVNSKGSVLVPFEFDACQHFRDTGQMLFKYRRYYNCFDEEEEWEEYVDHDKLEEKVSLSDKGTILRDMDIYGHYDNMYLNGPDRLFFNGLVNFFSDDKRGFKDYNGDVVVEYDCQDIKYPINNLFRVKKNEYWGVIDKFGHVIVPCKFQYIYDDEIGASVIIVRDSSSKYGLWSIFGHEIQSCEFDKIKICGEYCIATFGNLQGVFDSEGGNVVPFEYDCVWDLTDCIALVKKDNLWGMINLEGDILVPFEFVKLEEFHKGLAFGEKQDGYIYLINSDFVIKKTLYDEIKRIH